MKVFTFEFLPHLAGGVKRNADFSLYEIKWNNFGKWGFFEFQINLPNPVSFNRGEFGKNYLANDVTLRDKDNNWTPKRLSLYESNKGKVLTKMPDEIYTFPTEHLLLRLIFSFDRDERAAIADIFNFRYADHIDKDLISCFNNDQAICKSLKKYQDYINF